MSFNIAIDGPAGAGKSTIAKRAAEKLNFIYIDTGAMYRAAALYMLRNAIQEDSSIEEAIEKAEITIQHRDGAQQVLLNGENVTPFIRTEEVGKMASQVAANKKVRLKLVALQQKLAKKENVIMDGRDIGTYVLPDAQVKIYLTATSKARAERRYLELKEKGEPCSLEEIEKDIIARDEQDMNREFAPLKKAGDAVLLDSSQMDIEQVTERILEIYHSKK